MKKLLIMGMLALGLSVAAPQSHAQVRVRIGDREQFGAREQFVHPRAGLRINLGTPGYYEPSRTPDYYQPSETVIINRHDQWRHREWMRRRGYARMGFER